MYIERLEIENFRCFEKADLQFNYPKRRKSKVRPAPKRLKNVNLILGDNGSGKSSLFKAIALSVLAPVLANSGFNAKYLVRRTPVMSDKSRIPLAAQITAQFRFSKTDLPENIPLPTKTIAGKLHITRRNDTELVTPEESSSDLWSLLFTDKSLAFFLSGYSANRRSARPESYTEQNRSFRYQRVAGLFEDYDALIPFVTGYQELKGYRYRNGIASVLNSLLPEDIYLDPSYHSNAPYFIHKNIPMEFEALSDGYKTFIGWIWDLLIDILRIYATGDDFLQHITEIFSSQLNKPLSDIPLNEVEQKKIESILLTLIDQELETTKDWIPKIEGVVIVDEIDLFLHPEWQRTVIEKVATTFPNIQFFFSTHSPLVAGTLEPENIFVLESEPDGTATVHQYNENIHGLTANQILTSSYFGLSSTRAPGTEVSDISKLALSTQEEDRQQFLNQMAEMLPDEDPE